MPKYTARVGRSVVQFADVVIEADSLKEAKRKAQAGDYEVVGNWKDWDMSYEEATDIKYDDSEDWNEED